MSEGDPSGALRDIRMLFRDGMHGGLTDRQLLDRFVNRNESSAEDAFAVLLERHGPMVWGVCRRLLPDRSSAADAFQATFLVLVRRASEVRVDDSLGPWLYGVSRRVASRARTTALRQRTSEISDVEPVAGPIPDPCHSEQLQILDEEIGRLPERHREAVVLCDLEGLPHDEAARRLGCPVGTVESRLSRGRQKLRDRLVRRGLAPAAVALWAKMAREASAAVPTTLFRSTTRFVTSSPEAVAVPAAVQVLAEGVIRMMWLAKLKPLVAVAATAILATAVVAVQGRQQARPAGGQEQGKTAPPPAADAVGATVPDVAASRALAKSQLALIDEALETLGLLAQNGRISPADPSFSLWGRRRLETLRKTGAGKAEIIAALEKMIDRLKQEEAIAVARRQNAQGTRVEILDVQFRRMEAESLLNEEKAR